ncbi:hypothetical protein BJX63DRAFT_259964 [Aspergillus granulosus]|uniref:Uncharacterized protein n=1 Tax=Aspergillus granulosus TaxID=176169 RepID=A0ABR4H9M6_9EURO
MRGTKGVDAAKRIVTVIAMGEITYNGLTVDERFMQSGAVELASISPGSRNKHAKPGIVREGGAGREIFARDRNCRRTSPLAASGGRCSCNLGSRPHGKVEGMRIIVVEMKPDPSAPPVAQAVRVKNGVPRSRLAFSPRTAWRLARQCPITAQTRQSSHLKMEKPTQAGAFLGSVTGASQEHFSPPHRTHGSNDCGALSDLQPFRGKGASHPVAKLSLALSESHAASLWSYPEPFFAGSRSHMGPGNADDSCQLPSLAELSKLGPSERPCSVHSAQC